MKGVVKGAMKLITAIVQPSRFEAVKDLLARVGVKGLTVSDAQGVGRQRGKTEIYRGHEYTVNLIPKVKLEIAVDDEDTDRVIDTIVKAARTGEEGKVGDGKIFVSGLENAIRIRTGEKGSAAL
jgi:nitrogen regulatory protein P-II 1